MTPESSGATVALVHWHGPCAPSLSTDKPSLAETLRRSRARANYIMSRASRSMGSARDDGNVSIPTHLGSVVGSLGTWPPWASARRLCSRSSSSAPAETCRGSSASRATPASPTPVQPEQVVHLRSHPLQLQRGQGARGRRRRLRQRPYQGWWRAASHSMGEATTTSGSSAT